MADVLTESGKLSISLSMQRDDETKSRTFSIDNPVIDTPDGTVFRQRLQALQNFLLGEGNTLIQPTGWRDDDVTEEEFTTTAVAFTTSSETAVKWDTRLERNLTLSQSSFTYNQISNSYESSGTPITVSFDGDDITMDDLQVSSQLVGEAELFMQWYQTDESKEFVLLRKQDSADVTLAGTITLTLPAKGVYKEDSVTITIS